MRRAVSHPGIRVRHSRSCGVGETGKCNCHPAYEAWVFSRRDGKKIRKTFPTLAAAKGWRADAVGAVRKGTMRPPIQITLREAAAAWLAGAKDGSIRTRSGDPYKPSALRSYQQALDNHILPDLGSARMSEIGRNDVQDLADRLLSAGRNPSTIRNALMPLRAIYRRAIARGEVGVNPTSALELPAVRGRRDRIASPSEAAALLEATPEADRALWAAAMYAGLRRGELMALRWQDVDLAKNLIHVERAYDPGSGQYVLPKSRAGRRDVPIASVLRLHLLEHKARCPWSAQAEGLVFGRALDSPFDDWRIAQAARMVWEARDLDAIRLHECRHTFASLMIAAGVNAKALSTFMGHASITITLDRYGHLLPGSEGEAAALLDAYLARVS